MSLHSYRVSKDLSAEDPPFDALIFAALRKADTQNAAKIRTSWPDLFKEFKQRYNAPGGYLDHEIDLRSG